MASQQDVPTNILHDNRATYWECGVFSSIQYKYEFTRTWMLKKKLNSKTKPNLAILKGWLAVDVEFDPKVEFLATIYLNKERRQVVVAYRGTETFKALVKGYQEIWRNKISGLKMNSYLLVDKTVEIIRKNKWKVDRITFTGHSLGGFLAITSLFFAEDNQTEEYKSITFNAVAFESPGEAESLEKLRPTQQEFRGSLSKLDIVSFLSYPNAINTINTHIGTIIMMDIKIPVRNPTSIQYLKKCHSMEAIVEWLQEWDTVGKDRLKPNIMISWPIHQMSGHFFTNHEHMPDGRYQINETVDQAATFCLEYKDRLKALASEHNPRQQLPLRHFDKQLQEVLRHCNRVKLPDDIRRLRDFTVKLEEKVTFIIHGSPENGGDIWKFRADISSWLSKQKNIQQYLIHSTESNSTPTTSTTTSNTSFIHGDTRIEGNSIPTTSAATSKISFIRGDTRIEGNSALTGNSVIDTNTSVQEGVDPEYAAALYKSLGLANANGEARFIDGKVDVVNGSKMDGNTVSKTNLEIRMSKKK